MIIDYIGISEEAKAIKEHFRSTGQKMTAEKVCEYKNIVLIEMDTRLSTDQYKANYLYYKRQHIVQYNKKIRKHKDAVIYHEVGHKVLHWKDSGFNFHLDINVFNLRTVYEVEANVFSAEMLLDDEDVLDCLFNREMTFFDAARSFAVPDEILYFKCKILQARGYEINIPISAAGNFMKGKVY